MEKQTYNDYLRAMAHADDDTIKVLEQRAEEEKNQYEAKEARLVKEYEAKEARMVKELETEKTRSANELEAEKRRLVKEYEAKEARMVKELETEKTRSANELEAEKRRLHIEFEAEKTRLANEFKAEKGRLTKQYKDEIKKVNNENTHLAYELEHFRTLAKKIARFRLWLIIFVSICSAGLFWIFYWIFRKSFSIKRWIFCDKYLTPYCVVPEKLYKI